MPCPRTPGWPEHLSLTTDIYHCCAWQVLARYQPEAIVVCSGADSLSGDKLGCFNLSIQGHSSCLEFLERRVGRAGPLARARACQTAGWACQQASWVCRLV
jgi:acetoin utilization deacetylase AcuC-like enzyme